MNRTPASPAARARDLAVPVASCAAAGIGTGHLLDGLSRDELTALVSLLAVSADPARLRAAVAAWDGMTPPMIPREAVLRAAHAEHTRLRRAGLPQSEVPLRVRALSAEYRRGVNAAYRARKRAGTEAGRAA